MYLIALIEKHRKAEVKIASEISIYPCITTLLCRYPEYNFFFQEVNWRASESFFVMDINDYVIIKKKQVCTLGVIHQERVHQKQLHIGQMTSLHLLKK